MLGWYGPCYVAGVLSGPCLLLAGTLAASPAPTAPSGMTLEQALSYARAHQPSLRAAQARAAGALADAQVPRALWYPRAGASAQLIEGTTNNTTAQYFSGAPLDIARIGGTGAVTRGTWSPETSSFAAVGLRQELFDFGKIAAQTAVLDATAEAAGDRAETEGLNLELGVRESFFAVQAAHDVLKAAQAAYDRVKTNRDFAEAGVKSGLRSPIELTRAEADLMRLDVGRIRAEGSLLTAQGVFAAVVGVPQPLLDAIGEPPPPRPPPPRQNAVQEAEARDPEIREADARLRAQQAKTAAITRELLPDLQLSALLSGRAGSTATPSGAVPASGGFLPDVPNWDVGVMLNWQWFDATVFARRSASQKYEQAQQAELDSAKLQIQSAIEQAYAALDVAYQAVPALKRSVEAAQANYAQADARFRAGLGTSIELADAEAVRTEAEIQLALGQFEYARARARLGRAIAEAE